MLGRANDLSSYYNPAEEISIPALKSYFASVADDFFNLPALVEGE